MFTTINKQNAKHYKWGDNCDSWIIVDNTELSIKQELMPSKTKENTHLHIKSEQCFFITKGYATFYIDDNKVTIKASESIIIKPNTKHYISNETEEELEFLVISKPSTNNDRINL